MKQHNLNKPIARVLWRDWIIYEDDRPDELGEWDHNQLQNTVSTLLASLLKQDGTYGTGIQYLAVGEGLSAWDATPPTLSASDTTLETETFRKAVVPATEMVYIDALGGSVVGGPTRFIRITVTLTTAEANGDLREWGLFGGNATGAANSGLMIDWVSHGLIVKDSSMTIVRTIEFEFGLP